MDTLIGSQALIVALPHLNRATKDTDYFTTNPNYDTTKGDYFYHPALAKWNFGEVATLNELYTIKISHSFWELKNNTWNKHFTDILHMSDNGAQFIPELYNILYPIWEETHGKKKANLELDPEDFFNKHVVRTYEHDSIHASVAYYDEPLFNSILRDNHAVAVDRNKFDALTHEDKLRLVREEVYATALERKVIPAQYQTNLMVAYMWALRKTITSFSKGWFPLFIMLNAKELRKPEHNYVKYHKQNSHKLVLLQP